MESEKKREEDQQTTGVQNIGLRGMLEEQYRKAKENAETYPYVWASYIVVYGGFGLWTAYRWKKLHKTEDRVQAKQEILLKLVEAEEFAKSSSSSENKPPAEKTSKS
ncbi:hypothetical protein UlMin_014435 [Ulmus minor]